MGFLKLQIKEKIGEFISWKSCCCKKAPKNEILTSKYTVNNTAIESEIDHTDKKRGKMVHFSNTEEVIIIPPRSIKQRIWRPLAKRINYVFRNLVHYLCYPCIALIQLFFKGNTTEFGENGYTQRYSRAERTIPTSN